MIVDGLGYYIDEDINAWWRSFKDGGDLLAKDKLLIHYAPLLNTLTTFASLSC